MEHCISPKNWQSIHYRDGEISYVKIDNRDWMKNVKFKIERLSLQASPNQSIIMSIGNSKKYRILKAQKDKDTINIEIWVIPFLD